MRLFGYDLALLLMVALMGFTHPFAARGVWHGPGGHPPGDDPSLQRFSFEKPQMGVPFRIVLFAADEKAAEAAAHAAFLRIEALNQIFSDYEFDSELSRLSRTAGQGMAVGISPELWEVLNRSQQLAKKTEGAFDVTVGPSVNLWRKARREARFPRADLLDETRRRVGYRNLVLDPDRRTAELRAPNMRLDLGGIAKGYAIDEALNVLQKHGIRSALVSGGGDLAVSDPPPGAPGWRIEAAPLDVPDAPPARLVLLKHAALATSGDVFQKLVIDGTRYSHIVDPRTGIGLTDQSLVTVIASDGITADSLATAVSVLGPKAGMRLIEETPGAAALIVRMPEGNLEQFESTRFKRFLEE